MLYSLIWLERMTVLLIRPALLEGREYLYFLLSSLLLFLFSISLEFYDYALLTQFDDAVIEAKVLKHYSKEKEGVSYAVLKLRSEDGGVFYITTKVPLKDLRGYRVTVWIKTRYLTFMEYLKGFVTKGRVLSLSRERAPQYEVGGYLQRLHREPEIGAIYGALFVALPLEHRLQKHFSSLGVSHLLAISGFHLGVLTFILFTLLRYPYRRMQQIFFPYRHGSRDLFIAVALILGSYLLFLGDVASLIRAYMMLLTGYLLHDRGIKVISMQTLFVSVVLLLALMPKLFFSIGFWLSVSGVYFIFLYLYFFKSVPARVSMVLIPVWVYLLMTPVALVLFGNYSLYHPLSVVWSLLFTLFYPLSLLLHLVGQGDLLDTPLRMILELPVEGKQFVISRYWLVPYLIMALLPVRYKNALYGLLLFSLGVTVAAVYQVA